MRKIHGISLSVGRQHRGATTQGFHGLLKPKLHAIVNGYPTLHGCMRAGQNLQIRPQCGLRLCEANCLHCACGHVEISCTEAQCHLLSTGHVTGAIPCSTAETD